MNIQNLPSGMTQIIVDNSVSVIREEEKRQLIRYFCEYDTKVVEEELERACEIRLGMRNRSDI